MVFTKKSAGADGKPIGKTYTLRELAAALVRFVPLAPRAAMVWGLRRMEPSQREQVMLTVARANGCRYCSYIHQEWAIRTGASDEEIAQLEGTDPAAFDRGRWSALVYARSLAENDFGTPPAEIVADAARHHNAGERHNIEAVALVMTIVNRSANTMDALLCRLRGEPASQSLGAEVAITVGLAAIGPVIVPALSVILRKSPWRLLREFRAFTAGETPNDAQAA
ncbi:hypothetical protein AWB96_19950 [Mycobacteroides chelonae]|uniref:carboxymuconolactone decarboxylase family protein n=1 Tax=Mycobacteroides chelonae TaxID=1774 RepID=UPI000A15D2A1|nr:carboxymuconolactone decarboxylase family protein [Mycobacteroides chelonae]ORV11652.1 hypothetical protein AWB96_19950 [Mycobacteroides chelonae]